MAEVATTLANMVHEPPRMNALDRRITAALHVDGRASWRTIAAALDQPERTIARRGTQLLASRRLEIRAVADPTRTGRSGQFLLRASGVPAASWTTASGLAQRGEIQFVHLVSGGPDTVALIWCPTNRVLDLLVHELTHVPGVAAMSSLPVVRYIRTLHDWEPGILSADEVANIRQSPPVLPWPRADTSVTLHKSDLLLIEALRKDGRCAYEELARLAGISDQTAARRVKTLREAGLVAIRAVVDPADVGLPVGIILWLRARAARLEALGQQLCALPALRFAAEIIGEFNLMADLRLSSVNELHSLLSQSSWLSEVDRLESSMILRTLKHSDVLVPELRTPNSSDRG